MQINVAGAGAGKTSKMADLIIKEEIPDGKFVFCIAFTNSAVENIEKKVIKKHGFIPENIKISTIHSFLYQELINPYNYLIFKKHYKNLSTITLPDNPAYSNKTITDLESQDTLHIKKIPERAKWIVFKKSDDTKDIKNIRSKILSTFAEYCYKIYIDEAQDINNDIKHIFESLEQAGIDIVLYGDPKQDIRGNGIFQQLIDSDNNTTYIKESFRCPQLHLNISNTLACDKQKQIADKDNASGKLSIKFESEIDLEDFLNKGKFDLSYISKKTPRFNTHQGNDNTRLETLFYEVQKAVSNKHAGHKTELAINRVSYYISEKMLNSFETTNDSAKEIKKWMDIGLFDYPGNVGYAKMNSAFVKEQNNPAQNPVVNSIESIKGLEAKNCLFILTPDLAPYLFHKKSDENKTKHLLYVALTRSLKDLTILVTKEVETKYKRTNIINFISNLIYDN